MERIYVTVRLGVNGDDDNEGGEGRTGPGKGDRWQRMEEGSNTGGISLERCNLTTSKGLDRDRASATAVGGGRGQKREKEGPPIEEGSKLF